MDQKCDWKNASDANYYKENKSNGVHQLDNRHTWGRRNENKSKY